MQLLEKELGINDPDWMMSCREKLCLIGMLELLKPKRVIEFGYHKGGATKWLSKYSKRVITVDVNENVPDACKRFPNVEAWRMTTDEALAKIKVDALVFDLDIIDADHSRHGVKRDLEGLTEHCSLILLHDSYNPRCRKGMSEAVMNRDCAYNFDFVPSSLKHDGLWGGFGIVLPGQKGGRMDEYEKVTMPFLYLYARSIFSISGLKSLNVEKTENIFYRALGRIRIIGGRFKKLLGTLKLL